MVASCDGCIPVTDIQWWGLQRLLGIQEVHVRDLVLLRWHLSVLASTHLIMIKKDVDFSKLGWRRYGQSDPCWLPYILLLVKAKFAMNNDTVWRWILVNTVKYIIYYMLFTLNMIWLKYASDGQEWYCWQHHNQSGCGLYNVILLLYKVYIYCVCFMYS